MLNTSSIQKDIQENIISIFNSTTSKLVLLTETMINNNEIKTSLDFAKKFMFTFDSHEPFPINIDILIEMKVFDKKGNCKTMLIKHFILDTDYKLISLTSELSEVKEINHIRGGFRHKENIMLSVDCFKSMCMFSNSEEGKTVKLYYLDLEKVFKKYITAEFEKNQQQIKEQKAELLKERCQIIKLSKSVESSVSKNYHRFKFPSNKNCVYILEDPNNKLSILKFGKTNDINERLASDRTMCPSIKVRYILYTEFEDTFERVLKVRLREKLYEPAHEWIYSTVEELIKIYEEINTVGNFNAVVEEEIYKYNNEPKEKYEEKNNDMLNNDEYRTNVNGFIYLSERLRVILPSYYTRGDYERKNNEAPKEHRLCNGFCQDFVHITKFPLLRLGYLTVCMVCKQKEKIATDKIQDGELLAINIRKNPSLIEIGHDEKLCNICKKILKKTEFEEKNNRSQCKTCRYNKTVEKIKKIQNNVEIITDELEKLSEDKLQLRLKKHTKDELCQMLKFLKVGRKQTDIKETMIEKMYKYYIDKRNKI